MATTTSDEIGAEVLQNGQDKGEGAAVNGEGAATTAEEAEGEAEGTTEGKQTAEEADEAKAADNGGESSADDRAFGGAKTPPASQLRQTPPLSANTRASTRKNRSAAPLFQSSGGSNKRTSGTKANNVNKASNMNKSSNNNLDPNNMSTDDPFNFSTQSDVHPEPLKNISIERSSFNEVKFTKSLPSSADRYANMEKIAASRNPQLAASLSAQPSNSMKNSLSHLSSMTSSSIRLDFGDTPKSTNSIGQHATITKIGLSGGSTTRKRRSVVSTAAGGTPRAASAKKLRTSATKRRRSRRGRPAADDDDDEEEDEDDNDEEEQEEAEVEEEIQQQGDQSARMEVDGEEKQAPTSGRRGRKPRGTTPKASEPSTPKTPADAAAPKTPERGSLRRTSGLDSARKAAQEQKLKEDLLYQVPALSPAEQLAVDCPQEAHLFMGVGARVLALWGSDYYSANICGREALGRYYVHFVEDNLNRTLPPTGVIPLSALKPGTRISFIDVVNNDEIGKICEVVEQPATDDANQWARGEFKLRELDEDGAKTDVAKIVVWAKLFLNKEQGHQLLQQLKQQKTPIAGIRTAQKSNPVQDIDEENIISDARSFRRSRPASFSRLSSSASTSPFAQPPPMASAASSDDNNTSLDSKSMTTTPPRTPRRGPRLPPVVESAADNEREEAEEEGKQRKPTKEEAKEKRKTAEQREEMETEVDKAAVPATEQQKGEAPQDNDCSSTGSPGQQRGEQQPQQQLAAAVVVVANAVKPMDDDETGTVAQQRQQKEAATADEKLASSKAATSAEQSVTNKRSGLTESSIFAGLKFVLTSATRPNKKVTDFNKRDYRKKIEERGGRIIEDFTHPLASDETAYLIADTYYRTHKYLSALSLSIPCVSYKWVQQCVAEKKLTDHTPFLLPAGESSLDSKQQFEWKPLKGVLMVGKRVLIWSNTSESDPGTVSFAEIWTPILQNLGATLVGIGPGEPFTPKSGAGLEKKLEFCSKIEPPVDVLLAETDCQPEVVKSVEDRAGLAVSSEWVIQAIVTGSLPDLNEPGGEKFRYDFV